MEKIIDKVQKLLAMAQHENANEFEGQTAMLKAQKLLAKHGLNMSDVDVKIEDDEVVDVAVTDRTKTLWWMKALSKVIADNFRCTSYTSRWGGKSCIKMIGRDSDVKLAKEVFEYALQHMKHTADIELRKAKKMYGYTPDGYRNDYYKGYIYGLESKFEEQLREDQSLALVVVQDALVVQTVESKGFKSARPTRIASSGSASARNAGYANGRACDPNKKQVGVGA